MAHKCKGPRYHSPTWRTTHCCEQRFMDWQASIDHDPVAVAELREQNEEQAQYDTLEERDS